MCFDIFGLGGGCGLHSEQSWQTQCAVACVPRFSQAVGGVFHLVSLALPALAVEIRMRFSGVRTRYARDTQRDTQRGTSRRFAHAVVTKQANLATLMWLLPL